MRVRDELSSSLTSWRDQLMPLGRVATSPHRTRRGTLPTSRSLYYTSSTNVMLCRRPGSLTSMVWAEERPLKAIQMLGLKRLLNRSLAGSVERDSGLSKEWIRMSKVPLGRRSLPS